MVAIKKVLQDKRFKVRRPFPRRPALLLLLVADVIQNRELQIMRVLDHPNVCKLENSFYTSGEVRYPLSFEFALFLEQRSCLCCASARGGRRPFCVR